MGSRRIRTAVAPFLWVAFLATGVTGLFADALGLERSLLHRYSAYSLLVLTSLHLYLNRRALLSWVRPRRGRLREEKPSPEPSPTVPTRVPWGRRTFLFSLAGAAGGFLLGRWLPLGQPSR